MRHPTRIEWVGWAAISLAAHVVAALALVALTGGL